MRGSALAAHLLADQDLEVPPGQSPRLPKPHPPLPPERVDLGRVVGAGSLGEEELSVDGHPPTSEQGVDPAPDRRSELQGSDRLYQYTAVGPQHLWKAI